jgi:lipopolysaccharide transport system permease protein
MFSVFLVISGNVPGWQYVALFPLLAIQVVFAIGLGIALGVLNVFFRDVGQFFTIFLQFWFWLTPIVYPVSILPDGIRQLMQLNPMASLMAAYQTILVNSQWPQWHTLWPTALTALLLCALSLHLYRKHSGEMVDEL